MLSSRVKPDRVVKVVAACFHERPEHGLLAGLTEHEAGLSLTFVDSRVALIARVRALRPRVVLLPVRDARGVPFAPLVSRLRVLSPDVRILLLLTADSSRVGLAEAIRAGGEAMVLGGVAELRAVLLRAGRQGALSMREREATRDLLMDVISPDLRETLVFCATQAHRRLSIGDVATARGESRRTLGRRARSARWPAPMELIEWGRLLRASILQWRESSSLDALAHSSGFASVRALQRTGERLLHRAVAGPGDLPPLLVSSRLQRRVKHHDPHKST